MGKIFKIIFTSFIATFLIFLGVGYATVSLDFEIEHNVVGDTQEEVFITLAEQGSSSGTVNSSSFLGSLLTSDITLENTDSEVTMQITIHNNGTEPYCFIGTTYDTGLGYDNQNIKYELSFTEGEWDTSKDDTSVVETNESLTFNITFYHTGSGSNLSLESVIDFVFIPLSKAHKVTVIHQGNTYMDAIPVEETVATFPEIDFAFNENINATTTKNNVARCNNNALAEFDPNTRKITVTEVYSSYYEDSQPKKVNNADNNVKCKIYNSLTLAIGDSAFETSDYTINNFLVLNDIDDTGSSAKVPTNKTFNVDLNSKIINYNKNQKMIIMENESKVYINGDGTTKIIGGGACPTVFEVNNAEAELYITGGYYSCQSKGEVIYPKKGKIIIRNSTLYISDGNVFRVGLEPADEAAASNYSVHVEMIGGSATSVNANVIHSTCRKTVLFSFVNVNVSAGDTAILCNNTGGDASKQTASPAISVWKNVKFYMTGGSIYGKKHDFATTGARLYYTSTVGFKNGNTAIRSYAVDALGTDGKVQYLTHFVIRNSTSLTTEDWYFVKDSNGNRVKNASGSAIKVGSPLELNTTLNTNKALSISGVTKTSYLHDLNGSGVIIWDSDKEVGQTFTFLAQGTDRYLLVLMYLPKYAVHFDKTDYVNQTNYPDARNCKLWQTSAKHEGFYFKIIPDTAENTYLFISQSSSSIKALYLDVFGSQTADGTKVVGWATKNTAQQYSQKWQFKTRNSNTAVNYE